MGSDAEEISEAEIKARLMQVCPGAIGIDHIIEGCDTADRGFVVWDAIPPAGTSEFVYRL